MPRRKPQPESPAGLASSEPAIDQPLATQLSEPVPAPPEEPIQAPVNGHATETLRHRPIAPRPRQGDPAASFASRDIRITSDGRTWQVEARRELTGDEKDKLAVSGFQAVDDDEKIWNATQRELARRGTDINIVGMALGKPGLAQGRGR